MKKYTILALAFALCGIMLVGCGCTNNVDPTTLPTNQSTTQPTTRPVTEPSTRPTTAPETGEATDATGDTSMMPEGPMDGGAGNGTTGNGGTGNSTDATNGARGGRRKMPIME